jgi:transposase InsO family protein
MPMIKDPEQVCDTCITTKQRRQPFPMQAQYYAQKQLELIHDDLSRPVMPMTLGGRRYFLLLADDASRYMWAILLPSKDAIANAIKKVQAEAEKESGHKLRVLRTDNDGEFTVAEFAAYYTDEGIKRHFFARHSPQQNGTVERRNQTMVATTQALLRKRRLPPKYWGRR